jgi:hypothetical protein
MREMCTQLSVATGSELLILVLTLETHVQILYQTLFKLYEHRDNEKS